MYICTYTENIEATVTFANISQSVFLVAVWVNIFPKLVPQNLAYIYYRRRNLLDWVMSDFNERFLRKTRIGIFRGHAKSGTMLMSPTIRSLITG